MVEITMLTDELARLHLTPADIAAIGAALTAAAGAMLATKLALSKLNRTPEERIAASEAAAHEAQAVVDSMTMMIDKTFSGAAAVVKEALVVGSVLPDEVK